MSEAVEATVKNSDEILKGAGKSVDDVLSNKTLTNQKANLNNYESATIGLDSAKTDFNSMSPSNVRTYPNGTIAGDLPDGKTINIHPSTSLDGVPTVEIYDPTTGISTKIRY